MGKEMMIGMRTIHRYWECSRCLCVQLEQIPEDLALYYPDDYYSFATASKARRGEQISSIVRKLRRVVATRIPPNWRWLWEYSRLLPLFYRATSGQRVTRDSAVIDVGCGGGTLIAFLLREGFRKVDGIDPYSKVQSVSAGGRIGFIYNKMSEVNRRYGVVHACRSFEHMEDAVMAIRDLDGLCSEDGIIVLVIPAVGFGWHYYREAWVQLDAPRHICIHSRKSIEILAEAVGRTVQRWEYISTEFLFWGSEQYRKNIALREHDLNRGVCGGSRIFTEDQRSEWRQRARHLNACHYGDEVIAVLKKADV